MRNSLFIRNIILATLFASVSVASAATITHNVSGLISQTTAQGFQVGNDYVIDGSATSGQYLYTSAGNYAYGRWTMLGATAPTEVGFGAAGETITLVDGAELRYSATPGLLGSAKLIVLDGGLVGEATSSTIVNDIQIGGLTGGTGGLRMYSTSGQTYTFSGTITGSGTFTQYVPTGATSFATFTGDISAFAGTWGGATLASATNTVARNVQFGNNTSSTASNGQIGGTIDGANVGDYAGTLKATSSFTFAYNDSYQVLGAVTSAAGLAIINGGTANFMQGFANVTALTVAENSKAVFNGTTTLGATTNNGTLEFAAGSTATQTATAIGGTGSVIVSGGNVTLSQVNTYSNGTTISGGTLTISNAGALGNGAVALNGGRLNFASGTTTLANAISIGASGGTIGGAATSVTLSGAVNAVDYSTLTLEKDTTFTQNAVLYNVTMSQDKSITLNGATSTISGNAVLYDVNLGTGATIVLSGAANSIANINGASGLGNTVSLVSGTTTLTGTANTTFVVANGAELSLSVVMPEIIAYGVGAVASIGDVVIDAASGSVINVTLTDAFLAQFFNEDTWSLELEPLTITGLQVATGATATINLISVGDTYVIGDNGTWTVFYIGDGGDAVLGGGGGQGDPIIVSHYIPEPTTATLGVLGLAGLLLRRRRSTQK